MSRLNSQQLVRPIWPYQINPLSDQARGLLAWWPGNGGLQLHDLAGGKHAAYQGASAPFDDLLPSDLPAARNTSDTANYWTLGDDPFPSNPLTFTAWFVPTSTASGGAAIVAWRDLMSADIPLLLRFVSNNLNLFVRKTTNANISTPISAHREYFAAATINGTNVILYLNGRPVGSGTISASAMTAGLEFKIGRHVDDGSSAFSGRLGDMRFYNRALTPAEVYALYDPATRYDLYWMPWLEGVVAPAAIAHQAQARALSFSAARANARVIRAAQARAQSSSAATALPAVIRAAQARAQSHSQAFALPHIVRGASVRCQAGASVTARLAVIRQLQARVQGRSAMLVGAPPKAGLKLKIGDTVKVKLVIGDSVKVKLVIGDSLAEGEG